MVSIAAVCAVSACNGPGSAWDLLGTKAPGGSQARRAASWGCLIGIGEVFFSFHPLSYPLSYPYAHPCSILYGDVSPLAQLAARGAGIKIGPGGQPRALEATA